MLDKNGIAKRIAQEVQNGFYVNLGIGIPTLVANYIPKENVVITGEEENGTARSIRQSITKQRIVRRIYSLPKPSRRFWNACAH